jgi:hypothetical protein
MTVFRLNLICLIVKKELRLKNNKKITHSSNLSRPHASKETAVNFLRFLFFGKDVDRFTSLKDGG